MRILEIKFEKNWNFENHLRVWDFKKKITKIGTLEIKFWKKSELKIIWEEETMKIGNLGNHSKVEFLKINE